MKNLNDNITYELITKNVSHETHKQDIKKAEEAL